jgi:putative addiction module component (TIGR02574 family)
LACSLIDSLDATVDEGAESAWEQEIGRRIADLDSGRAKTVSWEKDRGRISFAAPLVDYVRLRKPQEILPLFGTLDFEESYNYKRERRRTRLRVDNGGVRFSR